MTYLKLWNNAALTINAQTIDDMVLMLEEGARKLAEMRAAGIVLDPEGPTEADCAFLTTD